MRSVVRFLALWGTVALASSARGDDSREIERQVQARYREGLTAIDAGKLEQARIAFRQAYALRPAPTIAVALGKVELRLGLFVAAAQHLTDAITLPGPTTESEQAIARKALAEAAEKIGRVVIAANVDAADVSVDGQVVGRSPLRPDQLYVTPGVHTFRASKEGYQDASITRAVNFGQEIQISLELQPTRLALPPQPVSTFSAEPPEQALFPFPKHANPVVEKPTTWRPVAIWVGAGLTATTAAIGTIYAIRYSSAKDDVDRASASAPPSCATPSSSCAVLADAIDHRHRMAIDSNVSFAVAGALAGITVATILLWPRHSVELSPSAFTLRAAF